MSTSLVESVWAFAHAASWFPGWLVFQLAAVMVGGLLVLREGGHRFVAPYGLGVLLAIVGAVALGSGGEWASWLSGPQTGPLPEVEIAGFGALFGLLVGHVAGARTRRVSMARALDVLAPSIGMMIAVARLGCFFAGCDFGRPTSVPWALRYPAMTPAFRAQLHAGLVHATSSQTLPVHPTQLYEACIGLVVLAATLQMRTTRRDGDRFVLAALLYAAGRIVVDGFRGDLARGGTFGLTVSQGLALALIGTVLAWAAGKLATTELEEGYLGIVTESSGTLPTIGPSSTPEERLGILCGAADDAIVAAGFSALCLPLQPDHRRCRLARAPPAGMHPRVGEARDGRGESD